MGEKSTEKEFIRIHTNTRCKMWPSEDNENQQKSEYQPQNTKHSRISSFAGFEERDKLLFESMGNEIEQEKERRTPKAAAKRPKVKTKGFSGPPRRSRKNAEKPSTPYASEDRPMAPVITRRTSGRKTNKQQGPEYFTFVEDDPRRESTSTTLRRYETEANLQKRAQSAREKKKEKERKQAELEARKRQQKIEQAKKRRQRQLKADEQIRMQRKKKKAPATVPIGNINI